MTKVDAHIITAEEYDEIPEMTGEDFARGTVMVGGKPARGRPKLDAPKRAVSIRLDADVIETLRAGGTGWQTRANALLRRGLKLKAAP